MHEQIQLCRCTWSCRGKRIKAHDNRFNESAISNQLMTILRRIMQKNGRWNFESIRGQEGKIGERCLHNMGTDGHKDSQFNKHTGQRIGKSISDSQRRVARQLDIYADPNVYIDGSKTADDTAGFFPPLLSELIMHGLDSYTSIERPITVASVVSCS